MPHKTLFTQAAERFELHRWCTEDNRRFLTPRALKCRGPGSASLERARGETSELQTAKDDGATVAAQAAPRSRSPSYKNPSRLGLSRLAPQPAGPWRSPQRRSTAPALPSDETANNRRTHPENATHSRGARVRHNPSLNHRTRYGGLSWPGLRYAAHFCSPGQAIPPHRAG